MIRFAVMIPPDQGASPQWLGNNRGHDYRTGKPGYDLTDQRHARLWIMKAHATRAARENGGIVVEVALGFPA